MRVTLMLPAFSLVTSVIPQLKTILEICSALAVLLRKSELLWIKMAELEASLILISNPTTVFKRLSKSLALKSTAEPLELITLAAEAKEAPEAAEEATVVAVVAIAVAVVAIAVAVVATVVAVVAAVEDMAVAVEAAVEDMVTPDKNLWIINL
jgi:hypothetical protein